MTSGSQFAHRAERQQVAGGEHSVNLDAAIKQPAHGFLSGGLAGNGGVHAQLRIEGDASSCQGFAVAEVAFEELRTLQRAGADEGDSTTTQRQQMFGGDAAAVAIVAAHRQAVLVFDGRAPAHEMRAIGDHLFELAAVGEVVAVAEQDEAVGAMAVLVFGVPVAVHLLERHQQVVLAARAGAGD